MSERQVTSSDGVVSSGIMGHAVAHQSSHFCALLKEEAINQSGQTGGILYGQELV
jgi:hypothetical protein